MDSPAIRSSSRSSSAFDAFRSSWSCFACVSRSATPCSRRVTSSTRRARSSRARRTCSSRSRTSVRSDASSSSACSPELNRLLLRLELRLASKRRRLTARVVEQSGACSTRRCEARVGHERHGGPRSDESGCETDDDSEDVRHGAPPVVVHAGLAWGTTRHRAFADASRAAWAADAATEKLDQQAGCASFARSGDGFTLVPVGLASGCCVRCVCEVKM